MRDSLYSLRFAFFIIEKELLYILNYTQKMEAPMARLPPIQRTSSIEREPRTLDIGQIQSARNLAIYILNTKTFEEASRIFTEVVIYLLYMISIVLDIYFGRLSPMNICSTKFGVLPIIGSCKKNDIVYFLRTCILWSCRSV